MFKDFDFSAMYMIFYCHELDIICNVVTTDDDVSITCTLTPSLHVAAYSRRRRGTVLFGIVLIQ